MHKLVPILLLSLIVSASAQESCPFGVADDPYPGQCGRYVDEDDDRVCDLSQPATSTTLKTSSPISAPSSRGYDVVGISAVLLGSYLLSFLLSRMGRITLATHRMFWNLLLTITFLVSCGLGILLTLRVSGYAVSLPSSAMFWHVEAGIAMTVISTFHIIWHRSYYRCILDKILGRRACPGTGKRKKG